MNNARRKQLELAEQHIDTACDLVKSALDEEQFSLDNVPESMQDSDRYYKMEDAIDCLSFALDSLTDAKEDIGEARA